MRLRFGGRRRAPALAASVFALALPATMAGADGTPVVVGANGSAATYEGTNAWFAQLKGSASDFRKEAKAVGLRTPSDSPSTDCGTVSRFGSRPGSSTSSRGWDR